ncbi:MAG: TonB-dependent receptor [Halieaceae bacterium]|nr:TonB-dependent receptor [Halieaceae bacterium]
MVAKRITPAPSLPALIGLSTATIFAYALPGTAVAQGPSAAIEEVIVSARRRQEPLQETPIAVSAFSGDDLAEQGLFNLQDFRTVVPNMDVNNGTGVGGAASIYIRGVGQNNAGIAADTAVGIYLDGVYLARPDGALLDNIDIATVEVLRGPQGTLFGKNTTGGAVLYNTNRPQDEFGGKLLARMGNYDRTDAQFVLNVPITDTVLTRFSGGLAKRDGYMTDVLTGDEYTDEDRTTLFGQIRWLASDSVTVDLNANYAETDQMARGQRCLVVDDVVGWQSTLFAPLIEPTFGRSAEELCAESEALDSDEFTTNRLGKYYSEATGVSATIDWEINESLSIKSITAWRNTEAQIDQDLDSTIAPLLESSTNFYPEADGNDTDQYSQEFQILGDALDSKLKWQAGAFFFREESTASNVGVTGPWTVTDLGPTGVIVNLSSQVDGNEAENTSWAVFAQADWSFADNWELTVGLRYTEEERELVGAFTRPYDPSTITTGSLLVPIAADTWLIEPDSFTFAYDFLPPTEFPEFDTKVKDDDWTPTVSLKRSFEGGGAIDGGIVYLTYSQGFLSGGIGTGLFGPQAFQPEEVDAFELGVKIDAWDRRLRMNAALFYNDYRDRQLTTIAVNEATGSVQALSINAEESTITGLELEVTLLPTPNLELSFNASWNDDEIDQFDDIQIGLNTGNPDCVPALGGAVEGCPVDRSDERLPNIPESSYFLAAQYTLQTSVGTFVPRIAWSLINDVQRCFDRSSCVSNRWLVDEAEDVSARLTWLSNDERWRITAYGTNLQDNDFVNGGVSLVDSFGFGGATIIPPRMYGVELQYDW